MKQLGTQEAKGGDYVLYWMQASARADHNPALEYAVQRANAAQLPLLVGFGLMDDYPGANVRHYRFLLEGLRDVRDALARRGIPFVLGSDAHKPEEVGHRFTDAVKEIRDVGGKVVTFRARKLSP